MTVSREELMGMARTAAANAYAPYSRFAVGAAVLLTDGTVVTGANVENASYGLSLCAETVALAKIANEGRLASVMEVAVAGGQIGPDRLVSVGAIYPCGRCRQVLNEAAGLAGNDLLVHCGDADGGSTETHRLSTLLPHAFGPDKLDIAP